MSEVDVITLETDILIIGGGAAGCYAAIKAKEDEPEVQLLIVEKGHIERSGCLGAGISSLNSYLNPGVSAKDFLEYVKEDSEGLVRDDLVYSIGQGVNAVADDLNSWGLPILEDETGNYQARGRRSIKIRGEKIKPLLARQVQQREIEVLNRVNISNYIIENGKVKGAYGFSTRQNKFYIIKAKAVICATGGAAGIYKANNSESAPNKGWYPPFNTGAGYAMGLRAGAEMTTFEMRFIALRVKDSISPTGVLAQGFNARAINACGSQYQQNYAKKSTPYRLYASLEENKAGRGPCYLDVSHLDSEGVEELKASFLNMSPTIVLKWLDLDENPGEVPVEITGTEPYLVGGHAQAGYWIDQRRRTTLPGLYAAGDVAGGAPKKYATGAMVEAELAVMTALAEIKGKELSAPKEQQIKDELERVFAPLSSQKGFGYSELKQRLQKIMDEYAGGISQNYSLTESKLLKARELLELLTEDLKQAKAEDNYQLLRLHEVIDRVLIAQVLVEHLLYRKESRWPVYQQRFDYPKRDDKNWLKFINSKYLTTKKEVQIIEREYRANSGVDNSANQD